MSRPPTKNPSSKPLLHADVVSLTEQHRQWMYLENEKLVKKLDDMGWKLGGWPTVHSPLFACMGGRMESLDTEGTILSLEEQLEMVKQAVLSMLIDYINQGHEVRIEPLPVIRVSNSIQGARSRLIEADTALDKFNKILAINGRQGWQAGGAGAGAFLHVHWLISFPVEIKAKLKGK